MKRDEDSFCVLGFLESAHGFESCIEVADVGFKSVCGWRNSDIDEVHERVATSFLETLENVVVDGAQTEDVGGNDSLQMLPSQKECCRRRIKEEMAVAVENSLLRVARMFAESFELQSRLHVSKQMNVAPLDMDAVHLQNLRQAW